MSQPCSSRHCQGLPRSVAMGRTCAGSPDAACIFNKNGKACQVQPGQTRLGACSFSFSGAIEHEQSVQLQVHG